MIEKILTFLRLTLSCQSGRRIAALAWSIALAASTPAVVAGSASWAHQEGAVASNGAVNVKSLAGGTYAATQNPTGAIAKVNQVAATQPPTVVIQATNGGSYVMASTLTRYMGNLGGVAGATAKCVAEFGSGWRFAWTGLRTILPQGPAFQSTWIQDSAATATCQNWTSSSGSDTGTGTNSMTAGASNLYNFSCNSLMPITCVSF